MKKIYLLVFCAISMALNSNAQYCTSNAISTADEEIFNFTFNLPSIDNTTNCSNPLVGSQGTAAGGLPNQYADFTSIAPASVFSGSSYPFAVTINTCNTFNYNSGVKIFVDFNQDGDFIDPGEEAYFSGVGNNVTCVPPTTLTGTIAIPLGASPGITRLRIIDWEGGQFAANTIVPCGTYSWGETEDYLINIIPPVACPGTLGCLTPLFPPASPVFTAGVINKPDTVKICPTAFIQLCALNSSAQSGITYQWLTSTNGGVTWTNVPGATNLCYTVPAGTPSAAYKFTSMCINNFCMDTTNNQVYVNVVPPSYATIPYQQGFETWIDYCSNNDVPDDGHWGSNPVTGNESWRRNDEGATANWTFPTNGQYLPTSSELAYSARFHNYNALAGGNLDLYVDLSTQIGNKELWFDFKSADVNNTMTVLFSTNGGGTFATLASLNMISNWNTQIFNLASNSPTCVIRFQGGTNNFNFDFGVDNLKILPPCTGAPFAGTMPDTTACPNDSFKIFTVGTSAMAGLTYTWQSSANSTGPWTTIGVSTTPSFTTVISTPTYFHCIVTCTASGLSDTTNTQFTGLNTFYYCYCGSNPISAFDAFDVGCVQLLKPLPVGFDTLIYNVPLGPLDTFGNAAATNTYTSFQFSLPVKQIYKDSLYKMKVTDITSNFWMAGSSKVYIDYNRNGIFDAIEAVGSNQVGTDNTISFDFYVPTSAQTGITGLRVITSDASLPGIINPCGTYNQGETEDYLVEIILPPCVAPVNPGIAYITDSILCPGYQTTVYDTSHTNINSYFGLSLQWQQSTNATVWTDIPGANGDSVTTVVSGKTYYRLKIVCNGLDSAYSNIKVVNMEPLNSCYPASGATGGKLDTADNGYFTLGPVGGPPTYSFNASGLSGPHVGNPSAIRARTNYSSLGPVVLYTDSTYLFSFYNILRPYNHADARITYFIDYDNNGLYDIPNERIFIGTSTATSFYLPGIFTTPASPAMDVATGMRLVLNNNTSPNNPSDMGIGLYTSGETEDFLVKFKPKPIIPTSVNDAILFKNVSVYPNPSEGIVFVEFEAYALSNAEIIVTNITGSEVYRQNHKNINGKFSTSLNLSNIAAGTYNVKIQTERGSTMHKLVVN